MTDLSNEPVSLLDLRKANAARQKEWCPDQLPDLSFRGNELGGECGEAQNVIKKLERERLGWQGSRATVVDLADELADVVICADLTALAADIDLNLAVARKFNATSELAGLATRLTTSANPTQRTQVVLAEGPPVSFQPTHRHKKRGTLYQVLATAMMQSDDWYQDMDGIRLSSVDKRSVVIYRGEDGHVWARPIHEFEDGRFEPLLASLDACPGSDA